MSGRASVEKGKRGEREIVRALQPIVDRVIKEVNDNHDSNGGLGRAESVRLLRNSLQTAVGGQDIVGLPWLMLEIKYQETTYLTNWWHQALEQTKPGQVTVLIHRKNSQRWLVRMVGFIPLSSGRKVSCPVDISFDIFLIWFENELKARYAN